MSHICKDSPISARSVPAASLLLRPERRNASGGQRLGDRSLLTGRIASPPIGSVLESDGQEGPESNESVGKAKINWSVMDDLLDADFGKHDYDWLLTPPATPHAASLVSIEKQLPAAAPKHSSTARSSSTARASRLSASQTENGHSARPARSSSVTHASLSSCYISDHNKTLVLNTNSISVTSIPSTPIKRPVTPSTAKTLIPVSYPLQTRSFTLVKTRSTSGPPCIKPEPSHNSRPATPTSRSQFSTSANSNSSLVAAHSISRPSTATCLPISRATTSASTVRRSPSVGRLSASNGRIPHSASSSCPSSPNRQPQVPKGSAAFSSRPVSPNPWSRAPVSSASSSRPSSPRPRAPVQPIDLPDFPIDVPPNLRTNLPERSLSASRARPGMALAVRANSNSEAVVPSSSKRKISVPFESRSKFPENTPKAPLHSNTLHSNSPEDQKPMGSEAGPRRTTKLASATESTGFGRTISKSSLAIKHMDIRQKSFGGIRGASVFPHSIQSTMSSGRTVRASKTTVPVTNGGILVENGGHKGTSGAFNGAVSCNMNTGSRSSDWENLMTRERMDDADLHGSHKYDVILMKEDLKNTSWLLGADDKSDQGSVFDHRFEPLPELFDPL
ncbi:uncharacterized protein LOC135677798 [Musa acuminata AAA Group]|uniref:uncharacterized protein LOC103973307 n=1 Tax=Musa acuminata AAA Group TaxID=214697 RepID=UPI0031CE0629